ncbi:MAG: MerR family transcriptional regulator [Rhizobiales bacterium]|nr:MerR family transcriptional regulator [Hyphomicrobiales bacterium]
MTFHSDEISQLEDKNYTIREVANVFSLSLRAIRFYEEQELISPGRRGRQTRLFRLADMTQLSFIVNCRRVGIALKTIHELAKLKKTASVIDFAQSLSVALSVRQKNVDDEIKNLAKQCKDIQSWQLRLAEIHPIDLAS